MNATAFKQRFDQAETVNLWSAPDMSILSAGRRSPPVLPEHMFGPIWPLLNELAEGAGAPVDYVALGYFSAAASLIGGRRRVRPYVEADWSEPCILWCGLVGDPSNNKSPALDRTTGALRELEREHAELHSSTVRGWHADVERAKVERSAWQAQVKEASGSGLSTPPLPDDAVEPPAPQRRRLLVQDSTPEKLAEILSGNPSGTLHLRDELAGWLTSFDRYTPGGREFWLEAFGGRPFVIDRKSSPESIHIPFNGVSVVGGIQPEKLADALFGRGKPDDGLVSRFLWAWPDRPPYARPRRGSDNGVLATIYRRLDGLGWGIDGNGKNIAVTLALEPKAADIFEKFERENRDVGDEAVGLFKSFCGKLPGLVLRLSLVSELARWGYEGGPELRAIGAQTVAAVAEFIEDYARPSAQRVFGDAALSPVDRNGAVLARYILKRKLRRFNARKLRRDAGLPGLKDAEPFNEALALLADADWVRGDGQREGDTPGRRTSDFIVNPAVYGGDNGPMA
jgi:putative DNA primase/helicase